MNLSLELEEKAKSFGNWLLDNHFGKENAVKGREMKAMWGDSRTIRHMVHLLRLDGVPICSGNFGYYYASTDEEIEGVINYLTSYIKRLTEARNGLRKALPPLVEGVA